MSTEAAADAWRGRIDGFLPHPLLRDAWPQHRRLRNAQLVWPLYHGDGCTGLNGLYAVVNAIRTVLARRRLLNDRECGALLEAGLQFLEAHVSVARCCIYGIRFQLWSRLARALAYVAEQRFQLPVRVEQPLLGCRTVTRGEALTILEALVVRQQVPVLMRRGGLFSVVSGYTPVSLLLVDSSGGRWLSKMCCGIVGDDGMTRHRLCPWTLTVFSGA